MQIDEQPLTAAGGELDDLDRELSDLSVKCGTMGKSS